MAAIPVAVIFGATASGKTALLESLFCSSASSLPKAEVISADSIQVYRGMDIGSAKPSRELLNALPHHLIDIRQPNEPFCAGDFVREADLCCSSIHARGKLPVVCGGTGFYIKNFVLGLPKTPEPNPKTRETLLFRMQEEGLPALYAELARLDPERAQALSPNDSCRILRSLEVCIDSGKRMSSFALPAEKRKGYRFLILSLDRNRKELYQRIEERCNKMFALGLEQEVSALLQEGFTPNDPGMRAIGYGEFFSFPGLLEKLINGETLTKDEAEAVRQRIVKNSRRYAKRQETFIRQIPDIIHVQAESLNAEDMATKKAARLIEEFLRSKE